MARTPDGPTNEREELARALATHRSGTPWSRSQESRWRFRVRRLAEATGQTPEMVEDELAAEAERLRPAADDTAVDVLLTEIAREHLDVPTLETRHGDDQDFHQVAVWEVRRALRAAFDAGRRSRDQER